MKKTKSKISNKKRKKNNARSKEAQSIASPKSGESGGHDGSHQHASIGARICNSSHSTASGRINTHAEFNSVESEPIRSIDEFNTYFNTLSTKKLEGPQIQDLVASTICYGSYADLLAQAREEECLSAVRRVLSLELLESNFLHRAGRFGVPFEDAQRALQWLLEIGFIAWKMLQIKILQEDSGTKTRFWSGSRLGKGYEKNEALRLLPNRSETVWSIRSVIWFKRWGIIRNCSA